MRRLTGSCFLLTAAVLLMAAPADAVAQGRTISGTDNPMRTGIGYQAVFPVAKVGVDAWHFIGASRFGVFVNAKTTFPTWRGKSNYCPPALGQCDLTAVQDTGVNIALRDRTDWTLFNGGAMIAVSPDLAVRLGGGMARRRRVREFFTPDQSIAPTGTYLVPYADDIWEAQFVGTILLRVSSSLALTFGYESAPRGLALGAAFVFP